MKSLFETREKAVGARHGAAAAVGALLGIVGLSLAVWGLGLAIDNRKTLLEVGSEVARSFVDAATLGRNFWAAAGIGAFGFGLLVWAYLMAKFVEEAGGKATTVVISDVVPAGVTNTCVGGSGVTNEVSVAESKQSAKGADEDAGVSWKLKVEQVSSDKARAFWERRIKTVAIVGIALWAVGGLLMLQTFENFEDLSTTQIIALFVFLPPIGFAVLIAALELMLRAEKVTGTAPNERTNEEVV